MDGSTDGSVSGSLDQVSHHSSTPSVCENPLAIDLVLYFSTLPSAACLSVSCRVCQAQTGLLWPTAMSLGISTGNWINCINGYLPLDY
jgi:hypothetical protein